MSNKKMSLWDQISWGRNGERRGKPSCGDAGQITCRTEGGKEACGGKRFWPKHSSRTGWAWLVGSPWTKFGPQKCLAFCWIGPTLVSAVLSCWLGAVPEKCGLLMNVVVGPKGQNSDLVNYAFHGRDLSDTFSCNRQEFFFLWVARRQIVLCSCNKWTNNTSPWVLCKNRVV